MNKSLATQPGGLKYVVPYGPLVALKEALGVVPPAAVSQVGEPVAYRMWHPTVPKCFRLSSEKQVDDWDWLGARIEPLYLAPAAPVADDVARDALAHISLIAQNNGSPAHVQVAEMARIARAAKATDAKAGE